MTIVALVAGLVLLVGFVAIERRVENPLLPLRIVRDRNRGGAYSRSRSRRRRCSRVFLFLTYYLQQNLGYSPAERPDWRSCR